MRLLEFGEIGRNTEFAISCVVLANPANGLTWVVMRGDLFNRSLIRHEKAADDGLLFARLEM